MKRIYLIGFMGSGKTTLGRAYAKAEQLEFVDLDWFIEQRYHREVREIFTERGENGFRELERQLLHEVGTFENVVIACGGGTPCFFDNMTFMNETGDTVYLDAHPQVLFERLSVAKDKRPLLADKSDEELKMFIREAIDKRLPYYRQAAYTLHADCLDNLEEIRETVMRLKTILEEKEV